MIFLPHGVPMIFRHICRSTAFQVASSHIGIEVPYKIKLTEIRDAKANLLHPGMVRELVQSMVNTLQ